MFKGRILFCTCDILDEILRVSIDLGNCVGVLGKEMQGRRFASLHVRSDKQVRSFILKLKKGT